VVLLAGGAAGGVALAKSSSGGNHHVTTSAVASTVPATHPTTAPASPTTVAPAAPPAVVVSPPTAPPLVPAERTAAGSLSTLLAQSVSDRTAIQDAAADVVNCGPSLSQDAQVFSEAANSRQSLIVQQESIPDVSALPPGMIQALTEAWTASEQADQDFASWASDEYDGACTYNDTADPNYQAATQPDDEATTYKTQFVGYWNPIATRFGLPTYSAQNL
jgi:hypothetical protein